MIYLRARYYDPTSGRFTTVDPAKDGLNWYSYCANNPILFSDPTGCIIQIEGGIDGDIFKNLSKLTDDELYIEDGVIKYTASTIVQKTEGTKLLRSIIDNPDQICKIALSSDKTQTKIENMSAATQYDVGTNVTIYFNSKRNDKAVVLKNNTAHSEVIPSEIALGHELIHAETAMKGKVIKTTSIEQNFMGKKYYPEINEALTTGVYIPQKRLRYYADYLPITTENNLRAENGYNLRALY